MWEPALDIAKKTFNCPLDGGKFWGFFTYALMCQVVHWESETLQFLDDNNEPVSIPDFWREFSEDDLPTGVI